MTARIKPVLCVRFFAPRVLMSFLPDEARFCAAELVRRWTSSGTVPSNSRVANIGTRAGRMRDATRRARSLTLKYPICGTIVSSSPSQACDSNSVHAADVRFWVVANHFERLTKVRRKAAVRLAQCVSRLRAGTVLAASRLRYSEADLKAGKGVGAEVSFILVRVARRDRSLPRPSR